MKLTEPQLALLRKLYRGYGIARHGSRRAAEARTLGRLIDKGLVESVGVGAWLPSATARQLLNDADARDLAECRMAEVPDHDTRKRTRSRRVALQTTTK